MFIQMLEGLQEKDAEVLIAIKNKNLNTTFKGLTAQMVKETFNWDDNFVRITTKQTLFRGYISNIPSKPQ